MPVSPQCTVVPFSNLCPCKLLHSHKDGTMETQAFTNPGSVWMLKRATDVAVPKLPGR